MYVHCRKLERGINLKFPCSPSLYTPLPRIGFHLTYLRLFHFLFRGYWKSFVDGLQRVLIFTPDEGVIDRIKAENSYSFPLFEASLAIRNIGISLVDNYKKRELAYIAITQWCICYIIWLIYSWIPDTQNNIGQGWFGRSTKERKCGRMLAIHSTWFWRRPTRTRVWMSSKRTSQYVKQPTKSIQCLARNFHLEKIFVFPLTLFCFLAWMKFLSHRFICYVVMIV